MPQIVIIANGGSSVSRKPTTHFSQTHSIIRGFQLPGAGALKDPQIWDGLEEGCKKSFGHFLHHEKEATLPKMHNVRLNVDILDKKICHLYEEAEKIKSCKKSCRVPARRHSTGYLEYQAFRDGRINKKRNYSY